jgi:hypothetical protein
MSLTTCLEREIEKKRKGAMKIYPKEILPTGKE